MQATFSPLNILPMWTAKDLARLLQVSVRTIKRNAKALNCPPTIERTAANRWSDSAARRFIARMRKKK